MKLRDYQQNAVESVMESWKSNPTSLVVLPTGCGKTVVFAEVINRIQPKRSMVVAHREELINQARDKIHSITGLDAQVEMADLRAEGWFGQQPQVVVSTIQTQTAGGDGGGRMTKFLPSDYGALVIDEAHHAVSKSYQRMIKYYRQNSDLRVLGVTATPDRADEEALGQVFSDVAFNYEILDAIRDGWLVPIEQQFVQVDGLDISGIGTVAGDLNQGELAEVLESEENLLRIASSTIQVADGRQTLLFAASVKEAERLCEIINRYHEGQAGWVCGKTDKDERHLSLADFASGKLRYMVNVGVLTEGYDYSGIEVVAMARPTKSRALYAQMAGRGTRPIDAVAGLLGDAPDAAARREMIDGSAKKKLLLVDFVGNSGKHKLVSSADILGGNYPDEVIEAAAAKARSTDGPVDMSAELEKQRKELEARKREEAAKRAALQARAHYRMTRVDPFDVFNLVPAVDRGWDKGKQLSDKQRNFLLRQGVDPDQLSFAQGRQLINEMFRRISNKESSLGQTKILQRHGFRFPVSHEQAHEMIDRIASSEGWAKRS